MATTLTKEQVHSKVHEIICPECKLVGTLWKTYSKAYWVELLDKLESWINQNSREEWDSLSIDEKLVVIQSSHPQQ